MVLLTKEEDYDTRLAYSMLNCFPNFSVNESIKKLNDDGVIVKLRVGSNSRPVPGRRFALSEK